METEAEEGRRKVIYYPSHRWRPEKRRERRFFKGKKKSWEEGERLWQKTFLPRRKKLIPERETPVN